MKVAKGASVTVAAPPEPVATADEGATVVIAPLEVDPCPAAALVAPEPESTVTGSDTCVVVATPAFATPVVAEATETCTEFVGARLLAVDTAFTAATGGAVTAAVGVVMVVGAATVGALRLAVGATEPPTAAVWVVGATVVVAGAGAGATVGCAATVDMTVGGVNTVGVTVTERIVPASIVLGGETLSPFTIPPLVSARRGRSIVSAVITAGPFT